MSSDQSANLLYAILALTLVASSLFARRLPMKDTLRMALAWIAIFAFVFALYALRNDFGAIWHKLKLAAVGESGVVIGGTMQIPMAEDGHFWVNATINGHTARFLIDSGATTTSLSRITAEATGVPISTTGFPVIVSTANGAAEARRATIDRLEIGPIKITNMPVHIMDRIDDDTNLLGMNFLSNLKNWRVEGSVMILEQ